MPGVLGSKKLLDASKQLLRFEVTSADPASSGYYIWARETWRSGEQRSRYLVDLVDGKPLILGGEYIVE